MTKLDDGRYCALEIEDYMEAENGIHSCEHYNVPSASIKFENCISYLNDHQFQTCDLLFYTLRHRPSKAAPILNPLARRP
jgi:hypothetical protein